MNKLLKEKALVISDADIRSLSPYIIPCRELTYEDLFIGFRNAIADRRLLFKTIQGYGSGELFALARTPSPGITPRPDRVNGGLTSNHRPGEYGWCVCTPECRLIVKGACLNTYQDGEILIVYALSYTPSINSASYFEMNKVLRQSFKNQGHTQRTEGNQDLQTPS